VSYMPIGTLAGIEAATQQRQQQQQQQRVVRQKGLGALPKE